MTDVVCEVTVTHRETVVVTVDPEDVGDSDAVYDACILALAPVECVSLDSWKVEA